MSTTAKSCMIQGFSNECFLWGIEKCRCNTKVYGLYGKNQCGNGIAKNTVIVTGWIFGIFGRMDEKNPANIRKTINFVAKATFLHKVF
ncbi:hypothetical protein [Photorhabdus luminescens]|uniref:Uncharacterized protein n=1 Tax=Photorhabdus luminescens subsp. sonorensis TaxID=1173677 RepID=A0A5C4RJX6_PHOLU|nr:hypothetical protein [Photorhabdus luminescens]TNH44386.1 hypothetical protein EP164_05445 [Photorhabdus luminescens subsp. sonorensis]